jgi:DnaK suppressor protein
MDKRQLKTFERKLAARYQELQATVQRNLRDRSALDGPANIGDIATASLEQEIVFGQNANVFQHLRLSQEALKRIDDGTFGYCTLCENEVSPQRLGAVPWTPLLHWLPRTVGGFTVRRSPQDSSFSLWPHAGHVSRKQCCTASRVWARWAEVTSASV